MAAPKGTALPYAKAWRECRWLTQEELEQQSGVKVATIRRVEHGENASLRTVRKLAGALGIAPEQLRDEAPERAKVAVA